MGSGVNREQKMLHKKVSNFSLKKRLSMLAVLKVSSLV